MTRSRTLWALRRRATPADTVPVARGGWLECLPDSAIAARLTRDARLVRECLDAGDEARALEIDCYTAPYRAEARRRLAAEESPIPS